jgi:hypothetical protein
MFSDALEPTRPVHLDRPLISPPSPITRAHGEARLHAV